MLLSSIHPLKGPAIALGLTLFVLAIGCLSRAAVISFRMYFVYQHEVDVWNGTPHTYSPGEWRAVYRCKRTKP